MKTVDQLQNEAIDAGVKVHQMEADLDAAKRDRDRTRGALLRVSPGWESLFELEAEILERVASVRSEQE